jgi:chromosome partitioning protein
MQIITVTSLSGGMGKTTTSIMLAKKLARLGYRTLAIDADPQSSLTFFLGHQIAPDEPTLLEMLTGVVAPKHAIYQSPHENLYLIPADGHLAKSQEFLANSGMGAAVLRQMLKEVEIFDYCVIDSPPQKTQLAMTAIGAAHWLLIPIEATTKGVNSLLRTLELEQQLRKLGAFGGEILGVIPFRDKWFGRNQSTDSRDALGSIGDIAPDVFVFPSILESQQYKTALRNGTTPEDAGFGDLELAFDAVIGKCLKTSLSN